MAVWDNKVAKGLRNSRNQSWCPSNFQKMPCSLYSEVTVSMTQQVAGSLKIPIPKISSYIYVYPSGMSPVNSIKCSSSMRSGRYSPFVASFRSSLWEGRWPWFWGQPILSNQVVIRWLHRHWEGGASSQGKPHLLGHSVYKQISRLYKAPITIPNPEKVFKLENVSFRHLSHVFT